MAYDGSIKIDTKLDTSGLQTGLSKLGGIAKSGLKATVTAIGAVGTALVGAGGYAVKLASDLDEVQNVVDTTFGKNAGKINEWAKNAATAFGMSELQAKQFNGTIGAMIKSMGLSDEQVLSMSMSLTGLVGDFASFYNLDHETAFEKIRSGISGETEPLKQLGINMSVANLEAYALAQGIDKSYNSMTQAEQATLRYNYLLSVSKDAQGDFAKTSDSFANQLRIAKLNVEDLASGIGEILIPSVNDGLGELINMTDGLKSAFAEDGLEGLVNALGGVIAQLVAKASEAAPKLIQAAVSLIQSFLTGIQENLPAIVQGAINAVTAFINGILAMLPQILQLGIDLLIQLALGIAQALPTLLPTIMDIVPQLIQILVDNFPLVLDAGIQLLTALVNGIIQAIPILIAALPQVIQSIISAITDAIPMIIQAGIQLLTSLVQALPQIISAIVAALPQIIDGIISGLLSALPQIIQAGIDLFLALIDALPQIISTIVAALPQIISGIVNGLLGAIPDIIMAGVQLFVALIENLPTIIIEICKAAPQIVQGLVQAFAGLASTIWDIGKNLLMGIWEGISNATEWLWGKLKEWCAGLLDKVKGFFGIESPSRIMRDEVGVMLAKGLSKGVEKEQKNTEKSMTNFAKGVLNAGKKALKIKSISEVMRDEIGAQIDRGIADGIRENGDTVLDEFNTLLDALKDKRELNIISEEEYYTQLEALTREHLDENSKEWRQHMMEVYQYQQETYEKSIQAAEDAYTKIADTAKKKLDEITKAQDEFKKKMTGGSLVGSVYSEADGSKTLTGTYLNDPNYDARAMTAYAEQIKKIQALAGDNAGFISQILREMDLATGQQFLNTLLNMEPGKLDAFLNGLTENAVAKINNMDNSEKLNFADMLFYMSGTEKKTAAQMASDYMAGITSEADAAQTVADLLWGPDNAQLQAETDKSFYGEFGQSLPADFWQFGEEAAANFAKSFVDKTNSQEAQTEIKAAGETAGSTFATGVSESLSKETMKAELEKTFGTVPDSFFDLGEDSADSFGEGFTSRLKAIFTNMQNAVTSTMASMSPVLVGGAGVGSVSTYNASYNFYGSGQTVSQQILAAEQHAEITRMRGSKI